MNEMTRNSDLVEMGIDEFADTPTPAKRGRKPKEEPIEDEITDEVIEEESSETTEESSD